jgi:hypothetical protein
VTQTDLERLERALAQGNKSVTFADGRRVDFQSFDELIRRIQYVRQSLGQQDAESRRLAEYTKGVKC